MNRDEKLSRAPACPPRLQRIHDRRALFPFEPGGGTWAGVNDAGTSLALINWYSVVAGVTGPPVSRGEVVKAALAADSIAGVDKILATMPLVKMNAFRLIGFFPAGQEVNEWRWNLKKLESCRHGWETNTWISSGFDEPGAQRARGKTFAAARGQVSAGNLSWLRRLHRSHQPACGPYSTCMHRLDAATVSYTEIIVGQGEARLRYHAGAPCCEARSSRLSLKLS